MQTSIADTLKQLILGEAQVFKNLAVFPLLSGVESKADYSTLAEALKGGQVRVTEVSAGGAVPELLLTTRPPIASYFSMATSSSGPSRTAS